VSFVRRLSLRSAHLDQALKTEARMQALNLPVEPHWLHLPRSFRVEITTCTTAIMAATQAARNQM
jgi:hypothetical protein